MRWAWVIACVLACADTLHPTRELRTREERLEYQLELCEKDVKLLRKRLHEDGEGRVQCEAKLEHCWDWERIP